MKKLIVFITLLTINHQASAMEQRPTYKIPLLSPSQILESQQNSVDTQKLKIKFDPIHTLSPQQILQTHKQNSLTEDTATSKLEWDNRLAQQQAVRIQLCSVRKRDHVIDAQK